MEYVYEQQPKPTDAKGVEVTLSVRDSNNNTYEIGQATSDASGMYKLLWKPNDPGVYTIIATFAGSKSYWPSQAETALGVTSAVPTTTTIAPTPTPAQTPVQTATPAPTTAAPEPKGGDQTAIYVAVAAVVIIIAIVAAAVILRKRK